MDDLIKVKSIKDQLINLSKCQLKRIGDTGYATKAELSTLHDYIEEVPVPTIKQIAEKRVS